MKLSVYTALTGLFFVLTFSACHKTYQSGMNYMVISENICPNIELELEIDTLYSQYSSDLVFDIKCILPNDYYFPVDEETKDTLTKSVFKLTFYNSNNEIITANSKAMRSLNVDVPENEELVIKTYTNPMRPAKGFISRGNEITSRHSVPMIVFHNLPSGSHDIIIELELIHYESFYNVDSTGFSVVTLTESDKTCVSQKIRLNIIIPQFLKTKFIVRDLKINDASFNGTWDFKIFGPGTPDVYWSLKYPYKSGNRCFSSLHYTNTQECRFNDTTELYHYTVNEPITISIYDSDDVSSDDFIDSWSTRIYKLKNDTGYCIIDDFDKLEYFEIKAISSKLN